MTLKDLIELSKFVQIIGDCGQKCKIIDHKSKSAMFGISDPKGESSDEKEDINRGNITDDIRGVQICDENQLRQ